MQNLKLLIGVVGGTLVLVLAVAFLFSNQSDSTQTVTADSRLTEGDRRLVNPNMPEIEADPDSESTESADTETNKVTIVEFSDLQCPACRSAEPLVQQVLANNPGRVELVYRHFPLEQIHPHAREAAIASEIVAEQGLFFEYASLLFEKQPEWSSANDPTELLIGYAEEVGADITDFETKLEDSTYNDLVEKDIRDGFALGVNSTPTFYVDGEKVNANELAAAVAERL